MEENFRQTIASSQQVEQSRETNRQLKDLNVAIREAVKSSDTNSRAMNLLTVALVIIGLASAFMTWLAYHANQNVVNKKIGCYQTATFSSDTDLAYADCLRSNGLGD